MDNKYLYRAKRLNNGEWKKMASIRSRIGESMVDRYGR